MVLSIGEILVDMIGENTPNGFIFQRKAGGAPFNVACMIASLNGDVSFFGSVGEDLIGQYLIEFAKNKNFKELNIKVDKERNTTLAFVELDENGERSFCFYRKNTADYILPNIDDELLNKSKIIHIGSLMLSSTEGREYATNIIQRAHNLNRLVSFDVNYREDIFKDHDEARNIFLHFISLADIIKISSEEIEILKSDELDEILKNKLIFISLGKGGSKFIYKGDSGTAHSIKVKVVDTTGAGDAFYGGVLYQLDNLPIKEWNHDNLVKVLRFANICGALNTEHKGAIDYLPDLETVKSYL